MSYGFDLGRLKSSSTGLSYVDSFTYSGGGASKTYTSPAFEFATGVKAFVMPSVNIGPETIPEFPSVSTSFSSSAKSLYVTVTGGNVSVTILVFVR